MCEQVVAGWWAGEATWPPCNEAGGVGVTLPQSVQNLARPRMSLTCLHVIDIELAEWHCIGVFIKPGRAE